VSPLRVGTAGWAIPRAVSSAFPLVGTGLQRYAARLNCAEINSSFYRSHRQQTYENWAASVPPGFSFAVKTPKAVTHEARLADSGQRLADFLAEARRLGPTLGPILVQLPPSLAFDDDVAGAFFEVLRDQFQGPVAIEPRHASWFTAPVERLLVRHRIARVAADPAPHPAAADPGGWSGLRYWRWHGSPRMYFTPYDDARLDALAAKLAANAEVETWCIFDNTASGAAAANALALQTRVVKTTKR
jgi:uncharacterized protein YecE (DUF72 family)